MVVYVLVGVKLVFNILFVYFIDDNFCKDVI